MKSKLLGLVLSLAIVVAVMLTACAPAVAPAVAPPEVKEPFRIGLTSDMTGAGAASYMPGGEALRCYVANLNDRGGIDGRKIELYVEDNRSEPPTALAHVKKFIDAKNDLIVINSLSHTYAGPVAECNKANMPLLFQGGAPIDALDPAKNRLLFSSSFCGIEDGISHQSLLAGYQKQHQLGSTTEGFVGYDIPVLRYIQGGGIKYLKETFGWKVVETWTPPGAFDLNAIALKFKEEKCDWVYCALVGGNAASLYEALKKVGWQGYMIHHWAIDPVEQIIGLAKRHGDKQYWIPYHLPFTVQEDPESKELVAMLKKYGAREVNYMSCWGLVMGRQIEAILRKTGYPTTTEKLLQVMNNLEVDQRPVTGKRIWTKDDHIGGVYKRFYVIDEQGKLIPQGNWYHAATNSTKLTDLGTNLFK